MLVPSGHRVIVKQDDLEEYDHVRASAAKAGVYLLKDHEEAQRAQNGLDRGTVVGVGPDAWRQFYLNCHPEDAFGKGFKPWAEVGDKVAFAKYSGKFVKDPDNDETYMVLNDEDIVCVIKETK